jgi:hypothetical protein
LDLGFGWTNKTVRRNSFCANQILNERNGWHYWRSTSLYRNGCNRTSLWSITIIDVAKKKYLAVKWLSFALERRHPRASILVSFRVSSWPLDLDQLMRKELRRHWPRSNRAWSRQRWKVATALCCHCCEFSLDSSLHRASLTITNTSHRWIRSRALASSNRTCQIAMYLLLFPELSSNWKKWSGVCCLAGWF